MKHERIAAVLGVGAGLACLPLFSSCGGGSGSGGGSGNGEPAYASGAWVNCGGPPGGLGYDIRHDPLDDQRWYVTDAIAGLIEEVFAG